MAGIAEMALGIATVLRSGRAPNPLPVDFRGYSPDDGAEFLRHLTNECADADIIIKKIRVDPAYLHQLTRSRKGTSVILRNIVVTTDPACSDRVAIEIERDQKV